MRKIQAVVKASGLISQEQDYIIEKDSSQIMVTEIGRFIADPNSEPLCVIIVDDKGYKKIHISFKSSRLNISLDVERIEIGKYSVKFNGQKKTELIFVKDEPILFEGPNPMFDYVNVIEILKMSSSGIKTANVKIIDWSSGAIEPIDFIFKIDGKKVVIDKGDENFNASFYLDDSTLIRDYRTKHEEYEFELVEKK